MNFLEKYHLYKKKEEKEILLNFFHEILKDFAKVLKTDQCFLEEDFSCLIFEENGEKNTITLKLKEIEDYNYLLILECKKVPNGIYEWQEDDFVSSKKEEIKIAYYNNFDYSNFEFLGKNFTSKTNLKDEKLKLTIRDILAENLTKIL